LTLIFLSKAFLPGFLTGGDRSTISFEAGLWQFQLVAGFLYVGAIAVFVRDVRRIRVAFRASWPLLMLAALAVASAMWSIDPAMTFRRGTALLGTTLLGLYAGSRVSSDELRRALRITAWTIAVGSIALVFLLPDLGVHDDIHDGYWRGAFLHKNNLGEFTCLAIVCFVLDCLAKRKLSFMPAVGIALCVWLLVGSGSRTGWIMTPLLAGLVLGFGRWEARNVLKVAAAAAVFLVIGTPWIQWSEVGALLGRDESLTGRIPLWTVVWQDILERPLLGYGYGAYWLGKVGDARLYWTSLGWGDAPQHAHNGFLDLWLECGLLGILTLSTAVVVFLRAQNSTVAVERATEWSVFALVLGFGCLGGELVAQNSMYWFLLSTIVTQRRLRVPSCETDRESWRPLVRDLTFVTTRGTIASARS
jgi:O-antigen ligase